MCRGAGSWSIWSSALDIFARISVHWTRGVPTSTPKGSAFGLGFPPSPAPPAFDGLWGNILPKWRHCPSTLMCDCGPDIPWRSPLKFGKQEMLRKFLIRLVMWTPLSMLQENLESGALSCGCTLLMGEHLLLWEYGRFDYPDQLPSF